jgi:SAM-dependent methyltransferase
MDITNSLDYCDYLKTRSALAKNYRRFYLYPRLNTFLDGRVLDVGCGIGDMLRFRKNTVGVDINPDLVKWCRSQGLNAHLLDGETLPFKNNEFQGAVLDNVLEHLTEPVPLLNEIHRVITKNGIFIVGVPGEKGYRSDSDHKIFYTDRELLALMRRVDFTCKKMFYTPFRSSFLSRNLRQYCIYGVFSKNISVSG